MSALGTHAAVAPLLSLSPQVLSTRLISFCSSLTPQGLYRTISMTKHLLIFDHEQNLGCAFDRAAPVDFKISLGRFLRPAAP
jgi:hypothetical protein